MSGVAEAVFSSFFRGSGTRLRKSSLRAGLPACLTRRASVSGAAALGLPRRLDSDGESRLVFLQSPWRGWRGLKQPAAFH